MSGLKQTKNDGAPPTIFVVDDETMLLELATAILQSAGYNARTFSDPRAALAAFSAANPRPAVLVTDYAMGSMNGLDLIRECRRIEPRQKVIMLSGTVDETIYAESSVKPDRFLAKPYEVGDFLELIQSFT
ncbi:MAG TPA: response regulator [Verrucomicrobiae bacterium]|nr:response regulator [Verrucomicrobiae bacterium]